MKVLVVCHGLFGIVEPQGQDYVEAVFLDAAGWPDSHQIPKHDLFIRYTDTSGKPQPLHLSSSAEISIDGMPNHGVKIESRPLPLASILEGSSAALKSGCSRAEDSACKLGVEPLIRARLRLRGGTLQNCEFDLVNGIDVRQQRNTWGSQHLEFEWVQSNKIVHVAKTFNAVLFKFDPDPEKDVVLCVNQKEYRLGRAADGLVQRLGVPDKDFALVTFNNTVPKSSGGHIHVDPNRDLHSLLFHEMLATPLAIDQRPVPRARLRSGSPLEAPPLNRCIPYSYTG